MLLGCREKTTYLELLQLHIDITKSHLPASHDVYITVDKQMAIWRLARQLDAPQTVSITPGWNEVPFGTAPTSAPAVNPRACKMGLQTADDT